MSIGFRIDIGTILGILLLTATATTTLRRSLATTFSTATTTTAAAAAAAAAAATAATIAPAPPTQNVDGEIKDIAVNVTLHDRRVVQLQVLWTDTLAADVSYNVIVSALNATACPDMPCSVYGIRKPAGSLLIPEQPMTYVEPMECSYMFGCNYTLTVETSNAHVQRSIPLAISDCVAGVCSCQHAVHLPKVTNAANIRSNDTIDLLFSIYAERPEDALAIKAMNMSLQISEQTNPSLSWGGKHISLIQTVYNISALRPQYNVAEHKVQGNVQVKVRENLTSNAMLQVRASIIDQRHCAGPENVLRVQVRPSNDMKAAVVEHDNHLRTGLVIVSVFFICTLSAGLIAGMVVCRRRSKLTHGHLPREGDYTSPLTMVEMEDNINYVDKDVQEAQAKGLADIFEVPHHAIQMGPEIGEGAFGRVYKATAYNLRRMRGASLVAVKQLKKNPTADEVAEFLGEIEMLKAVGTHHNIVCFLGCVTIRPPYMMLMEFVGRGDLLSYLRTVRYELSKRHVNNTNNTSANCNNVSSALASNASNSTNTNTNTAQSTQGGAGTTTTVKYIELQMSVQSVDSDCTDVQQTRQPMPSFAETMYTIIEDDDYKQPEFLYVLDNKELHNFAMQIANGMRFLEDQQITHRDLAARNVLIDDYKTLKISDFGLSRHGIYTNTKKRKLPLRWLSIEAIRDNVYSSKSDVWAYGVVLWEIGTLGASPYPTISNHELIPFLMSGQRLDKPDICTEQVYALMMQCWDEDPMQRPSFEELFRALSPRTVYVDASNLSDDYVFPPIKDTDAMR